MQTVRQLEFALFDFRLHAEYDPAQRRRASPTCWPRSARTVAVVRPPEFNRFPHSFQHVFSGGYAAGYYSYKWAEVLSADAFARVRGSGRVRPRDVRAASCTAILERGGSRDAMEAFVEFRGRKPEIEPLLRQRHGDGRGMRRRMALIATWNVNSLRVRLPHLKDWLAANPVGRGRPCRRPSSHGPGLPARGDRARSGCRSRSAGRRPTTAWRCCHATRSRTWSRHSGLRGRAEARAGRAPSAACARHRRVRAERPDGRLRQVRVQAALARGTARLRGRASCARHRSWWSLGDYNIAPEDRDVHDPKAWEGSVHVSEPERAALRALLASGSRTASGSSSSRRSPTHWWDYRMMAFRRNAGLRIDLILASATLAQKCGAVSHRQGAPQAGAAVRPRAGGREV